MVLLLTIKRIAILQSISYSECNKIVDRVLNENIDTVFICGGIRECREAIDIPKNIFGIVNLEDDIYIIKLLKNRNMYIAGRWRQMEGDVCIGGIDARNPIQNLLSLIEELPYGCRNLVLLSRYPVLESSCSSLEFFKKRFSIGFTGSLLEKILDRIERIIIISCNNTLDRNCIDFMINDKFVNIVLANHFTKIIIDFTNIRELIIE